MQGKLSSYVNNPVVSVSIEDYYSNKIYIIGAVRAAGQYQIYEPLDVMKAVAMCGGLSDAKGKSIKIIRADGTILSIDARKLWSAEGKRDAKQYVLYPGDTMYVPESFSIPWNALYVVIATISMTLGIILALNSLSN
jgi:polysaccharide export outer membrane protein